MKKFVYDNYNAMSKAAADIVINALKDKPNLRLGLPTGTTPIGMYDELAKAYSEKRADFSEVTSFNLDEYVGLPRTDSQSYWYFMNKHFYSRTNIQPKNTFIPNGTANDLDLAAHEYDQLIKNCGGIDIFIVGIGENGHIAFNEPARSIPAFTHVVQLSKSTIKANARLFDDISHVPTSAITLGMASILSAKKIILLASGNNKQEALSRMESGILTLDCPASLLNLHVDVTVLVC